ncbi:MAG: phosphonopyruvate decarboxylase [Kiritimatiellae bacterium]|nr:phosphonopyruvate decarboxylase [Kiritimatiellia bacterium]
MLEAASFVRFLAAEGVDFFTGVPDSLLKAFCAHLAREVLPSRHWIAANEGNAVALAAGHYLASGRPALVYMQNSGEGNAVNPLCSLADEDVYGIPMVLLVGWRGEPGGKPDEPQHAKQGKVTCSLLDTLSVPWTVLPDDEAAAEAAVRETVQKAKALSRPVALVVRAGTFATSEPAPALVPDRPVMNREEAIRTILASLPEEAAVVGTTGHVSREIYEARDAAGLYHDRDFLTVGSMGHASSIALGIALEKPLRPVVCLDGDGAALMHMGSLAVIGTSGAGNLLHVVLNNGAHGSVGGQPTVGFRIDLAAIAEACGYRVQKVAGLGELAFAIASWKGGSRPGFIEVPVGVEARKGLGRPRTSPQDNRDSFMHFLAKR